MRPATISRRGPAAGAPAAPRWRSSSATAAMADARRTDGSKRVTRPNSVTTPRVVIHRGQMRSRRKTGPASSGTERDVLTRGDREQVGQAGTAEVVSHLDRLEAIVSDDEAGVRRSAGVGVSVPAPDSRVRRRPIRPARATGVPGCHPPPRGGAGARPGAVRWSTAPGSRGTSSPRMVTRSPAQALLRTAADGPLATTSTRRPPRRAWPGSLRRPVRDRSPTSPPRHR